MHIWNADDELKETPYSVALQVGPMLEQLRKELGRGVDEKITQGLAPVRGLLK